MNKTLIDRRQNLDLRRQFDRAFLDLSVILPLYRDESHMEVITSYLKTYNLLVGHDGAKGRLIYKLGEV